ncbi:YggS family pyridoxal phosphate-dependent enzyme [Anaerotalea alkaliphila]|nr:YggS family pyridoxal phosphate-dependent enzyme [Anaerotalea alkaliphila]
MEKNLQRIRQDIEEACARANRPPSTVLLIAVTKTLPVERLQEAWDAGIRDFGENKVQEIRDKSPLFSGEAHWHMIGHLQTNKIKYIIDKVSLIHSVDSLKLAQAIDHAAGKAGRVLPVLVQVNVAQEDSKYGVALEECEGLVREIALLPHVRVEGLMTVAPFVFDPEENRPVFRRLKELYIDIKNKNIDNVNMHALSMGMSNDYVVAIEEGATMVRIGTALFGERFYK